MYNGFSYFAYLSQLICLKLANIPQSASISKKLRFILLVFHHIIFCFQTTRQRFKTINIIIHMRMDKCQGRAQIWFFVEVSWWYAGQAKVVGLRGYMHECPKSYLVLSLLEFASTFKMKPTSKLSKAIRDYTFISHYTLFHHYAHCMPTLLLGGCGIMFCFPLSFLAWDLAWWSSWHC